MKIESSRFRQGRQCATAVGLVGMPHLALGAAKKVVIVGGGTAGATAAKYIKRRTPASRSPSLSPTRITTPATSAMKC